MAMAWSPALLESLKGGQVVVRCPYREGIGSRVACFGRLSEARREPIGKLRLALAWAAEETDGFLHRLPGGGMTLEDGLFRASLTDGGAVELVSEGLWTMIRLLPPGHKDCFDESEVADLEDLNQGD